MKLSVARPGVRKNRVSDAQHLGIECTRTQDKTGVVVADATARSLPALAGVLTLLVTASNASEPTPTLLYDVTTETGMPHLEENLRYTITRQRRCLAHEALTSAFPILSHPALAGCRLVRETDSGDTVSFQLTCPTGHGTSGRALWQLGEHEIRGTLDVKLGGKNMTFYQRITAVPVGPCRP
jgi:hypothetical protein